MKTKGDNIQFHHIKNAGKTVWMNIPKLFISFEGSEMNVKYELKHLDTFQYSCRHMTKEKHTVIVTSVQTSE